MRVGALRDECFGVYRIGIGCCSERGRRVAGRAVGRFWGISSFIGFGRLWLGRLGGRVF